MILRYYQNLDNYIEKGKVLLIYGPRRSGKTTLLKEYLSNLKDINYRFDVGDDIRIQHILGSKDLKQITEYAKGYDMIVIDEAQYIPNIGAGLKLLIDNRDDLKIVATGSSSFDLQKEVGEPLTGRHRLITLYPIAQLELKKKINDFDLKNNLEDYLVFGSYPEILENKNKSNERIKEYLNRIVNSYLLKDVLSLSGIKAPKKLFNLLELIAFQVGNEVAHSELGQKLGMSTKTVSHYLDILEKMFVLINIRGFSRNLRKEVTKKSMYYFYDNGIRNAIISNFNSIDKRNDIGALWENFIISERIKKQTYKNIYSNNYFWRTYDQKEIDWIEQRKGNLFGYEIKWGDKNSKPPKDFIETYNNAKFKVINKNNYFKFIT